MEFREGKSTTPGRAAVVMIAIFSLATLASLVGCGSSTSTTTPPPPPPPEKPSLVVSDSGNNRVLIYNSPFTTDESASVVLGQSDFTSSGSALAATGMNNPTSTAEDSAGNLYVSDYGNNRVLQFKFPFTNGMSASLAIGQPDLVTGTANASQDGLAAPEDLAFDGSGNLWVVDAANARILQYKPPFATHMNASLVLGQANFTWNGQATSNTGLTFPTHITFAPSGDLWVSDTGNIRVLAFRPPFANGMAASLVIGQTDFVSNGTATTASGFEFPSGIAFDSAGDLWMGDVTNYRVLEFKPPFATGMSASLVLGQTDFTTAAVATTQNGMNRPFGIAFDSSGNLYVADEGNSRTLQFAPPFSSGQNASLVLGQPNFTFPAQSTTATGQTRPFGVTAAH